MSVTRRPHRTPAETLRHLEDRRRLAAADRDFASIRVDEIDAAIDRLRNPVRVPMEACALEHDPVEEPTA